LTVKRGGDVAAALSAIDVRSAGWRFRQFRRETRYTFPFGGVVRMMDRDRLGERTRRNKQAGPHLNATVRSRPSLT
jgi:hypothetical protein